MKISNSNADKNRIEWIFDVPVEFDPLLARIDMLKQLSIEDRLNWICAARSALVKGQQEPVMGNLYSELACRALQAVIDVKLRFLDKLFMAVLSERELVEQDESSGS